jgi:putative flippase GtrA
MSFPSRPHVQDSRLERSPLTAVLQPHIRREFLRFIIVGVVATAMDFAVLATLTSHFQWHYLAANTISFSVGNIVSYCLSIRWVFKNRREEKWMREFLLFVLIGIGGLGISELCIFSVVEFLRLHYSIGKLVAVGTTLFWNYGVKKVCLFRARRRLPGA